MNRIVVIGCGGHGKVVSNAILIGGTFDLIGFVDSNIDVGTEVISGYNVIEKQERIANLKEKADYFVVAIGNNEIRKKIYLEASKILKPATIIHPSAILGFDVTISEGTVVLANAIINSSSHVGVNTIVNAGSIIDHDCFIGNHIHLSIG